MKDKETTVLNVFIKAVNESNCKLNKLSVDQGKEFYYKLMQEWLGNNGIIQYSLHNEGRSVIAGRFIKPLKGKIHLKNDSQWLHIFSCLFE